MELSLFSSLPAFLYFFLNITNFLFLKSEEAGRLILKLSNQPKNSNFLWRLIRDKNS